MTTQELAAQIKQKYPVYKNLDDVTLVAKIVEKYPVYKTQLSDAPQSPSYLQRVGQDIKQGFQEAKADVNSIDNRSAFSKGTSAVADVARGVIAPISEAPGFKQLGELFGKGVEFGGQQIEKLYTPEFKQKLANMSDEEFRKFTQPLQDVKNFGDIANTILLAKGGQKTATGVGNVTLKSSEAVINGVDKGIQATSNTLESVKHVVNEVVPSLDRLANESVSKALQLTPGDIKNIEASTGNVVGRFMADNNLIGNNLKATQAMVKDFFDTNYKAVRSEISKVTDTFKQNDIPRYTQALTELKDSLQGIAGKEKELAHTEELLNKKVVSLDDVQAVKELLDKEYSLYKVTGDVKEGRIKSGLVNMRTEIKQFIEQKVKDKTGIDIQDLNNKVGTSKSILDAAEKRATSGITKSNIQMGDLGFFGVGFGLGGPLVGAALVFAKKALQSPAIMFRMAKYFDKLSDARKIKLAKQLQKGAVPAELEKIAQSPSGKQTKVNAKSIIANTEANIDNTIPKSTKKSTPNTQGGFISIGDVLKKIKDSIDPKSIQTIEDAIKDAKENLLPKAKSAEARKRVNHFIDEQTKRLKKLKAME